MLSAIAISRLLAPSFRERRTHLRFALVLAKSFRAENRTKGRTVPLFRFASFFTVNLLVGKMPLENYTLHSGAQSRFRQRVAVVDDCTEVVVAVGALDRDLVAVSAYRVLLHRSPFSTTGCTVPAGAGR